MVSLKEYLAWGSVYALYYGRFLDAEPGNRHRKVDKLAQVRERCLGMGYSMQDLATIEDIVRWKREQAEAVL